jgi:hypothetical protein
MDEFLRWILFAAALETVLILAVVMAVRGKNRRTTGPARFAQPGPRTGWRLLSIPALVLLGVVLWGQVPGASLLIAMLVASLGVLWLQPHLLDQVCGQLGVQNGWRSRSFADLEEWRLTGDHLRFRLDGIWVAVPSPSESHEELRGQLLDRCPGRESRFSR